MPNEPLNPVERELEAALGALAPAAPGAISPESIAFALGRASARPQLFAWRGVAAVLALACGASILLHASGNGAAPTINNQNLATGPGPAPTLMNGPAITPRVPDADTVSSPFASPVGSAYLTMRSRVNARGLSALPEPVRSASASGRSAEIETAGGPLPSPSARDPRVSPILRSILFLRGA